MKMTNKGSTGGENISMRKLFKNHSTVRLLFDICTNLETETWIFLGIILYLVVCTVVSCFIEIYQGNFFMNALAVMVYGVLSIICIAAGFAVIYGIVHIIRKVVEDILSTYQYVKERPGSFAIEGVDYNMTNTGLIAGGQTVLTAPYKCTILNRPVADSKTVYERGYDLFLVSAGADVKPLLSPKNLVLTELLVEQNTEIGAGEILAIYEEVQLNKEEETIIND